MKIAIMTQPLGMNFGGMMQAYALQKVMRDLGHEVITIDYTSTKPNLLYKTTRLSFRLLKKFAGKRKAPLNLEAKWPYIYKNTIQFIKQNISISESIDNETDLIKHFNKNSYDVVVVGSDQTWRPKYSPNINNFYLNFLNGKKIKRVAYASSFGVDYWESDEVQTSLIAELAKKFDAISVREMSGVDLCKQYLDVKSECVLDPTLLLGKEDYLRLIGDRYQKNMSRGVFTYFLDNSEEKQTAATQLAKKLKTDTYKCQAKLSTIDPTGSLDDYKMPAVEDWLASFANAEFVLTDSFHGMVFSIIFEKPFLVVINKERGAARFESLLEQLDCLECLVEHPKLIMENFSQVKGTISKEKIENLKYKSMAFLNGSLDI